MSGGTIFDIQRFSVHDGPGIRTTVFLKGCPLRCAWCQNPEGLDQAIHLWNFDNLCVGCGTCAKACPHGALSMDEAGRPCIDHKRCLRCGVCIDACSYNAMALDGYVMEAEELAKRLLSDRIFFETSGGGVTFSGGEPLLQAEFVAETAKLLRASGIDLAVETALDSPWEKVKLWLGLIDYFQVDIKFLDPARHRAATGRDNERILDNFRRLAGALSGSGRLRVRIPLVPGYGADAENLSAIAEFVASVDPEIPVELMNFNPLAGAKYRRMRIIDYPLAAVKKAYADAEMEAFRDIVSKHVVTVE